MKTKKSKWKCLYFSNYFVAGRGAKHCDKHVCRSVCILYTYIHTYISKMTSPNFMKYSVHVNCGHGLILLWWQCNTLCISRFADDITFSCNGPYGTWCWQYRRGHRAQASSQNFQSICRTAPCCLPFSSYTTAVNHKCDAYNCLVPASNNMASQKSLSTYHWLERQRRFLTHQMLHIFQQFIIK